MTNTSINTRLFIVSLFIALGATIISAQGTGFNFQGRLNDGTNPANGRYDLQFRLYDAIAGGNQTGAVVTRPDTNLVNGVFSTTLDFGSTAFDDPNNIFIEIEVRPAGSPNAYTVLGPRQRLTAVPVAVRAVKADALTAACVGCVADAQIMDVSGSKVTGLIPTESVPVGSGNYIQNAAAAGRPGAEAVQQAAGFNIDGNGILGGSLGIGTATPTSRLQVVQSNGYGITQTDGTITVGSFINSNGGWLGTKSNHPLNFFTNDSQPRMTLSTAGNLGIGTATPSAGIKLEVNGQTLFTPGGSGGDIQFGTPATETGMSIVGLIGRADVRYDGTTLKLVANGGGGPPAASNGIAINNQGRVGVGTNTPQAKFHVNGSSWFQGDTSPLPAAAGKGIIVGFSGEFGYISSFDYGAFVPKNLILNLSGANVGIGTSTPQAKLDVAGTTKTNILQITGGSDLAENFEIDEGAKPGMVVSIGREGRLAVAHGEYNTRVAGIISGANNLSAGMVLPNLPGAKLSMPVALNGRVWVYADAVRRPIKPGDLLTTSSTPGHAMKVANYRKAQGAIIGKAMTELREGKGLVLVLVTLQ